ncbi:hypothetical protein LCGC14_2793410, partial [marine sediment metagenome]
MRQVALDIYPKPDIKLMFGDCLTLMPNIPDCSVDMIMADPPYGTTACKWDSIIPLEPMWKQLKRVIKKNSAIVMTASQPFTTPLISSNMKMFKYEWIWEKAVGSNFAVLEYQPMKEHENIPVFGNGRIAYNPIMQERKGSGIERQKVGYVKSKATAKTGKFVGGIMDATKRMNEYSKLRNPSSVQFFNNRERQRGLHPTQKPVAL